MRCENGEAARMGRPIYPGACSGSDAARIVTITYREGDTDTLLLCNECARAISRDARRHRYKVSNRKVVV